MHELGHALGLAHPSDPGCPPVACSSPLGICAVMDMGSGLGDESTQPYADDITGVRVRYGLALSDAARHREGDGVSWYDLTPGSTVEWFTPLASASSAAAGQASLVVDYRSTWNLYPYLSVWDWYSLSWTAWGTGADGPTYGAVGAAWDGSRAYSHWLRGETSAAIDKTFAVARHTSPSARTAYYWSGGSTRRQGVMGTHDPRHGVQVLAWRRNDGEIRLQVVAGTGAYQTPFGVAEGTSMVEAFDTPSVACGEASVTKNCIVVWADPGKSATTRSYHAIRWLQFSLSNWGGTYVPSFGPIGTTSWPAYRSPIVTYRGPSTSAAAFVLAFSGSSPDLGWWTARKAAGESESFVWDGIWHGSTGNGRSAFVLGSASRTAELAGGWEL